jgi:LuxR family maltose regulon positive regulatory protein
MDTPIEPSPPPSGEFVVSRGGVLSFHGNRAAIALNRSSSVVVRQQAPAALRLDARPRLKALSDSRLTSKTQLLDAWRHVIALRIDDALATIAKVEIGNGDVAIGRRAAAFAEVLRAVLIVLKNDDSIEVRAALAVLETRQRTGGKSSALAAALRIGYWRVRDFDRYYAVPRLSHAIAGHRCTHGFATIIGPTYEAIVEAEQLRLAVAKRIARTAHERALSRFGNRSAVTARAAIVLAELLYEEGQHAGLDSLVMQSLVHVRESGDNESTLRGYRLLVRLVVRRGDLEFAFLILKEAEALAARRNWGEMMSENLMLRIRLLLDAGRVRDAATCIERLETFARHPASSATSRDNHALARALLLVATGHARPAATILGELQAASGGRRNHFLNLRLSIHLADALLACGDQAEGRAILIQALHAGSRAGIYQTFVDAGAHVADLLMCFHHARPQDTGLSPELRPYIGSILAERSLQRTRTLPVRASRVTDSLSPRECSVLRSMSSGLSNKRIAQELQIAPETVKSHVKGIFLKLAVQSRAHAVSTAGALGLL